MGLIGAAAAAAGSSSPVTTLRPPPLLGSLLFSRGVAVAPLAYLGSAVETGEHVPLIQLHSRLLQKFLPALRAAPAAEWLKQNSLPKREASASAGLASSPSRAPAVSFSSSSAKGGSPRRVRVGFLSSFFDGHSVGFWIHGNIIHLSRETVEVVMIELPRSRSKGHRQGQNVVYT